jgi:hypothetical protein
MLKRGRITIEQAKAAVEIYKQIPLNLMDIDLVQAVELASQLNIYALDAGLVRAAKTIGIDVLEVTQTDANIS